MAVRPAEDRLFTAGKGGAEKNFCKILKIPLLSGKFRKSNGTVGGAEANSVPPFCSGRRGGGYETPLRRRNGDATRERHARAFLGGQDMYLFDMSLCLFDGEGGGAAAPAAQGETQASTGTTRQGKTGALSDVKYGKQPESEAQTEQQPDAGAEEKVKDVETTSDALEAKKKAFRELINGEYKDLYTQETQRMIDRRFKEARENEKRMKSYQPVLDTLMERYGIDDGDAARLLEAVDNDHAYWSEAAEEAGMSEEQYKEFRRLKRENAELLRSQQEQQQNEFFRAQGEKWYKEAEAMKGNPLYQGFDLMQELQNPEFLSLLKAGTPVEHAYRVLHFDELMGSAVQAAAASTEKKVADSVRAKGNRPNENGTNSNSAFVTKTDPSKLTRADFEEIERRVARGERISF
uniref:Uncharacterized protein n=1 Tax=Siphoviridae sp. ctdau33 TaxID=2827902 RepID=A0A8S5S6H4_9CAUD|nr:MAG TPA: hypothetical protein [Siphoviridae sp. ctdau33]DAG22000.1 MAG TPA: hypothetical protein [Bacteriophage sp.]